MLILDIEIEHLARARQRGLRREAAVQLMLKRAHAQLADEPAPKRHEELGPVARFLANVAAHA